MPEQINDSAMVEIVPKPPEEGEHDKVTLRPAYGGVLRFNPKNHRYYWAGEDGIEQPLPAVTSIAGMADGKEGLISWAARIGAETAVKHIDEHFMRSAQPLADEAEWAALCQDARDAGSAAHRLKKEVAADEGTEIHEYAKACFLARNVIPLPDVPDTDFGTKILRGCIGFGEWFASAKPFVVNAEYMVMSHKLGYAGRTDAVLRFNNRTGVLDVKTGNTIMGVDRRIYPHIKMQLTAYTMALLEEAGGDRGEKWVQWVLHLNKTTGKFELHQRQAIAADFIAFASLAAAHRALKEVAKT